MLITGICAAEVARTQQPAAQSVQLTQTDEARLSVRGDNAGQQPCWVRVWRASTGQTLFRHAYAASVYGTTLNFDRLPAGRYRLLVQVGAVRYVYAVQVTDPAAPTTMSAWQQRPAGARKAMAWSPIETAGVLAPLQAAPIPVREWSGSAYQSGFEQRLAAGE